MNVFIRSDLKRLHDFFYVFTNNWLVPTVPFWLADYSCVQTRSKHDKYNHKWNKFRYGKCLHQTVHSANRNWNMIETTSQASFNHAHTKHVQNGGWVQRGGECPNSVRTQNPASPSEIAKTQSNKRHKLLSLSKKNILNRRKPKCRLLVKSCIALLLRRAWKLTLNWRMNATVTVLWSSTPQLKSTKFLRVP